MWKGGKMTGKNVGEIVTKIPIMLAITTTRFQQRPLTMQKIDAIPTTSST
jgi:hypothetical protein